MGYTTEDRIRTYQILLNLDEDSEFMQRYRELRLEKMRVEGKMQNLLSEMIKDYNTKRDAK